MTNKKDKDAEKAITVHKSSRSNTLLLGALVGAGAGLIGAVLLNRRAKNKDRESMITASEGVQLALLVFGLLRAISSLGDDD